MAKVGEDGPTHESGFDRIGQTAWLTAHWRTFSDIPLSREIFEALENVRRENGVPPIPDELKDNSKIAVQLEARYKLLDRLLARVTTSQVLEVAAGMSTRGLSLASKYPGGYVEFDLPAMMEEKRKVVENMRSKGAVAPSPNLKFVSGNALEPQDLAMAAALLAPGKPLAIINEGLMRYLNFEQKSAYARNVHDTLTRFGGVWITPDITLSGVLAKENEIRRQHTARLLTLTGVKIDANRFDDVDHAKKFFGDLGFESEVHSFMEVQELESPKALGLTEEDVEDANGIAVAFVMHLKT